MVTASSTANGLTVANTVKPGSVELETPVGLARVHWFGPVHPRQALVIGHGAGGGVESADLQALAAGLASEAVAVLLVEQPWRVEGRRIAVAPARLDEAWRSICSQLAARSPQVQWFHAGRSAGARVVCRTAEDLRPTAVVALAFPLHPPGKPEKSRLPELLAAGRPTLVLQGTRDRFGTAAQVQAALEGAGLAPNVSERIEIVPVVGADHGFRMPAAIARTQDSGLGSLVVEVAGFMRRLGNVEH